MLRYGAVLVTVFFISPCIGAQENSSLLLDADNLDFYLWQSFQAQSTGDRLALNHIGIQVLDTDQGYLVSAVLEGYPAHVAGINRGDLIERVNGEPYHPVYSFNDSVDPKDFIASNDVFNLSLRRDDTSMEVSLTPVFENLYDSYRSATLNSVQEFSAGNKVIGYIRFWGISRSTNDLVVYRQILRDLDHCDGLIFDLRNSVGYLDLLHLDSVYASRNNYFQLSGAEGWLRELGEHSGSMANDPYRRPIAVLINGETRGGPELLAYQLDKLQRVITIGEASGGMLGDYLPEVTDTGSRLRYRSAEELRVDGEVFESRGLAPEQSVPYPPGQTTLSDPQYQAAVNTLMGII